MKTKLLTVRDIARELEVSERRARKLCIDGRIVGAQQYGKLWIVERPLRIDPPLRTYTRADVSPRID